GGGCPHQKAPSLDYSKHKTKPAEGWFCFVFTCLHASAWSILSSNVSIRYGLRIMSTAPIAWAAFLAEGTGLADTTITGGALWRVCNACLSISTASMSGSVISGH